MKTTTNNATIKSWIEQWLRSVASNEFTMSQRKVSSIKKRDIELAEVIKVANKYKVHLLLLKDDKGVELVAASKDEFKVLC